jgi:catechol 2,3-dioxygenase-like lactoylglutathione lyase family enzyme
MTLVKAPVVAFVATADAARASKFYGETLCLTLVEDSAFALVFEGNGTMIRIQKVGKVEPHPYTALGWTVGDISATVAALASRGVVCMRPAGLHMGAGGIWTSPSGAKIAWFKDPDGNVLSVTEFP